MFNEIYDTFNTSSWYNNNSTRYTSCYYNDTVREQITIEDVKDVLESEGVTMVTTPVPRCILHSLSNSFYMYI